jgi:hypothetical protein
MDKQLKEIAAKLDVIVKLLCNKCIEGKSKTDSILALEGAGVDRELISALTKSTPASIRSTIHAAKKNEKGKTKRIVKEEKADEQSQG